MKIKKEDYNIIKKALQATLDKKNMTWQEIKNHYILHKIGKNHIKRACFDLYHASGLLNFTCDVLYKYINDNNLYTTIKHIVKKL